MEHLDLRRVSDDELYAIRKQVVRLKKQGRKGPEIEEITGLYQATDKQNTDRAVFGLKRLIRVHEIPIFVISSLNRENYAGRMSLCAFKESGAIEYFSDVLLGLQFAQQGKNEKLSHARLEALKCAPERQIEVSVLKNRNGASGRTVSFLYRSAYNCFSVQQKKYE